MFWKSEQNKELVLPSVLKVILLFLRFADVQMHLYQVLYVHSIEFMSVKEIFVKQKVQFVLTRNS